VIQVLAKLVLLLALLALPHAAFGATCLACPTGATSITSSSTTDLTAHDVSVLSGATTGRLVTFLSFDFDPGTVAVTGGGWTSLGSINGAGTYLQAFYRNTFGGVGGPNPAIQVTTTNAQKGAFQTYFIDSISKTYVPEAATATGTSTTADPPAATPTWGGADTLWLVGCASDADTTFSADPASYTSALENDSGSTTTGSKLRTVQRALNAVSEDPGTFTNTSREWNCMTVALPPILGGFVPRRAFRGGP
jgi:hypothetical protein